MQSGPKNAALVWCNCVGSTETHPRQSECKCDLIEGKCSKLSICSHVPVSNARSGSRLIVIMGTCRQLVLLSWPETCARTFATLYLPEFAFAFWQKTGKNMAILRLILAAVNNANATWDKGSYVLYCMKRYPNVSLNTFTAYDHVESGV